MSPAAQREQEHVLHGERRLVHHAAHLRQQRVEVEDRDFREPPHEIHEQRSLAGIHVHAGDQVPATPSSTPGENTTKKLGWNESQRTSRRLATRRADSLARHVEGQRVTELDAKSPCILLLDRHLRASRVARVSTSAGDEPIVAAQRLRPGQVGLALDEARGTLGLELELLDGHFVDGGKPRTHHRHQLRGRQSAIGEERTHGVALVRADVDHEVVGRVGRQARPPFPQQVVAHQREQQQHHEAEPEGDDLHDAVTAAA